MSTRDVRDPRLYTILPDAPFLDTLANAVLRGDLPVVGGAPPDRSTLTRWTILLPTRRAVRALRESFLRVARGTALLLPRIRALGDVDEDALSLSSPSGIGDDADVALDMPLAIGNLQRRLALTRLVLAWSRGIAGSSGDTAHDGRATPAQAASLAAQLAALMDTLDTEQVSLEAVAGLVPERFADHWQRTLSFLEIVTEHWPDYLDEHELMSPYARRNALMAAETERLRSNPPDGPVIAAGSTATVPATADLLEAVARLDDGAVVLPGLDLSLDDASWHAITVPDPHPEHPQFGMQQFLARLGVSREQVTVLDTEARPGARATLVSEVMRPAGTTDRWLAFSQDADRAALAEALAGMTRIDAPTEQDEAEVVSLILRRAVEDEGRTAALVTPDRTLARRVSARLERWGLEVDDSAGTPLAKTPPGAFAEAVAEAVGAGFAPVPLLGLLKHPLTRLGRRAGDIRRAARLLELVAFRQPATGRGIEAHRHAAARARTRAQQAEYVHPNIARLGAADWEEVDALLDDLERAVAPLQDHFLQHEAEADLETLARCHIEVAQNLARDETRSYAALWRGPAGEALADLFEAVLAGGNPGLKIESSDYPDLYRALVAGLPVRPHAPAHPRIFIWGPLEARLQRPDTVVLGGLNEGKWPATVESDPWLNRPMRAELGLSAPERGVGLSAHDVAQLLGVESVYLTRSEKVAGAPTVASRWLLRLDAVLAALGLRDAIKPADPWVQWAAARDSAVPAPQIEAPAPCPPTEARPKGLSVTRIETWMANPYAIFARDILRLYPLEALAGEPDAALRGSVVHDALMAFAQKHPTQLPPDIAAELIRIAHDMFSQFGDQARVEAFWRGQMENFAAWFAATETERRQGVKEVHAEVKGMLTLDNRVPFTLTARADRIDLGGDGSLAIYDYKTGAPPSLAQVDNTYAPQLALEAAIAAAGGFEGLAAGPVSRLAYIRARGYGEGGAERDASNSIAPETLAGDAIEKLGELVTAFASESEPYKALRRPRFSYRFDDYAHLARVPEWQSAGGEP